MPVDKTELAKDLETPEYQGIVKEALEKKEFVIRTKADETAYLDRFKTDVIEKEIPTRVKGIHDQYDKDIKELYGVERAQDEKTYDYLKRVAKGSLTKLGEFEGKVKTLEEQIKKGDPTGALAKQLEEAENKYKAELSKYETKVKELETSQTRTEKRAAVSTIYAGIKIGFKKELPALFSRTEKAILEEVEASSVLKDGRLFMANPDGTIRKDAQFKEISVEDFLRTELKEVIDSGRNQGGSGSGGGGTPPAGVDPSTITADNFEMIADIKTKDDLMSYMLKLGLKRGEKVFNDIWNKHSKNLKLA
jgi:hypothetical protein